MRDRKTIATIAVTATVTAALLTGAIASSTGATASAGRLASAFICPTGATCFAAGYTKPIYVGPTKVYTPPASTTTTVAATTTTRAATTTTTAPTTTTAGSGRVAFAADLADPQQFGQLFDHGWSGEVHAGALFGDARNDWPGDHDSSCGDPNNTHRTVHLGPGETQADAAQAFYTCQPGGDPAKGHLMTSVNTEGYVIAWIAAKGTFSNVHRVCWDQSEQQNGGGKWTQVLFLTPAEYTGKTDLGYTSPEFPAGGPSTPNGTGKFGIKDFDVIQAWQNGAFTQQFGSIPATRTSDHAARFRRCVTDNENGTLTITAAQPNGTTATGTIPGQIPNGAIRVVWEDDNYNPDKHYSTDVEQGKAPLPPNIYSWHWDNFLIET